MGTANPVLGRSNSASGRSGSAPSAAGSCLDCRAASGEGAIDSPYKAPAAPIPLEFHASQAAVARERYEL